MKGFKSLTWGCLIFCSWILSMASFQPPTPNSAKNVDREIHDNPREQQGYLKHSPVQKLSGHDFRNYRHEKDPARDAGKPLPFIDSFPDHGVVTSLLPSLLRHHAYIIPSQNGRTLIYPFHSFM